MAFQLALVVLPFLYLLQVPGLIALGMNLDLISWQFGRLCKAARSAIKTAIAI